MKPVSDGENFSQGPTWLPPSELRVSKAVRAESNRAPDAMPHPGRDREAQADKQGDLRKAPKRGGSFSEDRV